MGISTFFGLNVGMSALNAAQQAESVISNNIANSNTPGYVQETAVMQEVAPYPPLPSTNAPIIGGQMGQGSQVQEVQRITNAFLNKQDRLNQGTAGMYDTLAQNMTQIEQIINEPSSQSLQNALDTFFGAWQTLSSTPNDISARQAVISAGQTLGQTFQTVTTQLEDMQSNLSGTVQNQLQELNSYAKQVATLNQQIIGINNLNKSGQSLVESPNQLMDQRGYILDEMSKLANVSYTQNSDGSISVSIASGTSASAIIPLVSVTSYFAISTTSTMSGIPLTMSSYISSGVGTSYLSATLTNNAYMIDPTSSSSSLTSGALLDVNLAYVNSGQIAGNTRSLDELNTILSQFDGYLTSLANEVNSIQTGTNAYNLNGNPSTMAFFTLKSTSANNVILNVNPSLTASDIAAAIGVSGYNENAIQMVKQAWNGNPTYTSVYNYFSLETGGIISVTTSNNATFDQMLTGFVSQLGINAAAANSNQQTADALAQQSSNLRQSVSGVSINEQASLMVEYQNIFSAAAKFISIYDQMLQTLVNMVP